MPKIEVLPFEIANLIAAGEVVDRPSSVIKELAENAIDAGATTVTIEIQNGGVKFMRVTDNGCGMTAADMPVAIQRHATSKIRTAEDLNSIGTLGFRGEALAAIASVSRLRILSKTADDPMGACLECSGGEIVSLTETGCSPGTTIIAEDLFYNVPARRKFLKKDTTEAIACGTVAEKIALSHPEISLRFISDGELKFRTAGDGDLSGVIYVLFGREYSKRSLLVDYANETGSIRVTGFVSEPDMFRPNRNMENFFINGRYVKSKTAAAAVEQAYASKIPHDKFPFCVLDIKIAPGAVDVNVHPAKLEVKFTNEKVVFDTVYYGVCSALEAAATRPELRVTPSEKPAAAPKTAKSDFWTVGEDAKKFMNAFVPVDTPQPKGKQISLFETAAADPAVGKQTSSAQEKSPARTSKLSPAELKQMFRGTASVPFSNEQEPLPVPPETITEAPPEEAPPIETMVPPEPPMDIPIPEVPENIPVPEISQETIPVVPPVQPIPDAQSEVPVSVTADPAETLPEPEPYNAPEYIILGEAYNTYIIVQLEDRLLMIDKHAAHERILFDSLCRKMREREHTGQLLLIPYELSFLRSEADMAEEYKESLEALGYVFTMKETSVANVTVSLHQIPDILNQAEAGALFSTLVSKLADATGTVEAASAVYFESRLWQAACKAAIKGGRLYDMAHLRWICDRLLIKPEKEGASVIRTCPHGRPVAFEIKKSSIERQFARLV
ncbi:MAG: DNA mismatch repair endonuclease MutL [Clostridia bacterium]|nr:DNA mismatch repair endonuclease MutL [Clostridia bacterium]